MTASSFFVGIDVAKATLDLARSDQPGKVLSTSNDAAGLRIIVDALRSPVPTLIAIESTGGYERPLIDALLDAKLPVALVSPKHVRHFAIGMRILAKTDRIDARTLALFAEKAAPRLCEKRSKIEAELEALVTCRRQLSHAQTEHKNRRQTTQSKPAIKALDAVLATLHRQIENLDQQIRKLIESDDDYKNIDRILRSVPGVGPVLSSTLTAELRELGRTDRRQISSLVGVAPFNHDSGNTQGKRRIRGGRADVRGVLYMATIAATRFNPIIKKFAERLQAQNKPAKVWIVACMRKLLGLLNAMVRDNLTWDQLTVVKSLETA